MTSLAPPHPASWLRTLWAAPVALGLALVGVGAAGLLLGALGFQFLGGLAPCEMCLWQRWPHLAAALLALAGLALLAAHRRRAAWVLLVLASLAVLVSAGLGVLHAGVEQGWWQVATGCTIDPLTTARSGASLEAQIAARRAALEAAAVVRCDEIPWSFLGLSMAGWNALTSAVIAGLGLVLAGRGRTLRPQ